MKTSSQGIQLIKDFEGLHMEAYRCPAGVLTIGYGHTRNVREGQKITLEQAETYLKEDLLWVEKCLNNSGLILNQNQFDALASFIYNIGEKKFLNSTLFRYALKNAGDSMIQQEFLKWNKARVNGILKSLPGLTRRRTAETQLYFKK